MCPEMHLSYAERNLFEVLLGFQLVERTTYQIGAIELLLSCKVATSIQEALVVLDQTCPHAEKCRSVLARWRSPRSGSVRVQELYFDSEVR